jgi:dethiobiotin synthetase
VAQHIFITATNTGIGKTYTTLKLMHAFAARGHKVGVIKPIETGVTDIAADGALLLQALKTLNPNAWSIDLDDIVPVRMRLPAAPYVAKGSTAIDWEAINRALFAMEAVSDICLIEGAGGLLVPVDAQTDMIDMIPRFNAKALLVSHCELGCINDLRLSLEALERRGLPHEWVLNCRDDMQDFAKTSQAYFDTAFPGWFTLQKDIEQLCDALLL